MHDKNLHIIPGPDKEIPKPEIPVDDAWNNMADLLDKAMPVSPPETPPPPPEASPSTGGGIYGSSQFWTIIGGVLIIAGALTWGVVSILNKPERQDNMIAPATVDLVVGSSDTGTMSDPEKAGAPGLTGTTEPVSQTGKQENNIERIINTEIGADHKEAIQSGTKSQEERGLKQPVRPGTRLVAEEEPPAIQAQVPAANVATPDENRQIQPNTNIEKGLQDNSLNAVTIIEPPEAVADSAKAEDISHSGENQPVNPAGTGTSIDEKKQSKAGKEKISNGMSKNLSWQIGISGNTGAVLQKGRDPNLFYGGMVTAGLWHEELKAGMETGVGYEVYEDYGTVTENIRFDSIPVDTMGNIQYLDTTRFTAYNCRYQYIQVPFFINKQIASNGKFSFDLKTGPLVGFMIADRKSLDYITGPAGGETLSTTSSDYTRLKISWQWQIIPQLRWNFNEKLSLLLSPNGVFYLNNLYDKKSRPANMPFGFGVNVGLIYRFK